MIAPMVTAVVIKLVLTVALDEVPKNKWVDENLFSDTENLFFGIKFLVKRFVGRSPENLRWGKFGQARP